MVTIMPRRTSSTNNLYQRNETPSNWTPYQSVLGQSGRGWKINPDDYMAYKFDPITRRRTYQQMDPTEIYRDLQSGHFTFDAPAYDNRLSISAAMYDTPDTLRAFQDRQQEYVDELIDIVPGNVIEEYRVGSGPNSYLNVPELMRNYDTLSTAYPLDDSLPQTWEEVTQDMMDRGYPTKPDGSPDFRMSSALRQSMETTPNPNAVPALPYHERVTSWGPPMTNPFGPKDGGDYFPPEYSGTVTRGGEQQPNVEPPMRGVSLGGRRETPVTPEDVTPYDQAYVDQAVADALSAAPQRRTDEELAQWATDQGWLKGGTVEPGPIADLPPIETVISEPTPIEEIEARYQVPQYRLPLDIREQVSVPNIYGNTATSQYESPAQAGIGTLAQYQLPFGRFGSTQFGIPQYGGAGIDQLLSSTFDQQFDPLQQRVLQNPFLNRR